MSGEHPATAPDAAAMHATYVSVYVFQLLTFRLCRSLPAFAHACAPPCSEQDKRPLVMPILKGGFIFAADLVRAFSPCPDGLEVEFVSARSYGARTETSGEVEVSFDAAVVSGRHVLMVDDLCDSGLTLLTVRDRLIAAGAASVRSVVLLDKKERRKVEYDPDYIGFDCPNKWVAGAGMDTHQLWRASGDVWVPSKAAIAVALGRHA